MEAKEEKPKFSENNDDIASEISFTPARYVKTDELMKVGFEILRVLTIFYDQSFQIPNLDARLEKMPCSSSNGRAKARKRL